MIKHYVLPQITISSGQFAGLLAPKYSDSGPLANASWVAYYFNSSVLVISDQNPALEAEADVITVDDIYVDVTPTDATSLNALAAPVVGKLPPAPVVNTSQSYRDALLALTGMIEITMTLGVEDGTV